MVDNYVYTHKIYINMSLNNSKPVQKLVIGGEPLKKSVLTETQKVTTVITPTRIDEEKIEINNEVIEPLIDTINFSHEESIFEKVTERKIEDEETIVEKKLEPKDVEIVEPIIPNNNLIKDEETLKMLKSLNFWSKFHIILGFISSGFLILAGLIYVFLIVTIPLSIIYWIIAGITIWLLTFLYKAFGKFNELTEVKTQDEFNVKTLEGLNYMKSYYKITGIFNIVSFVALILLFVLAIVLLFTFGNNPEFLQSLQTATDAQKAIGGSVVK